jgi:hypothetical protein
LPFTWQSFFRSFTSSSKVMLSSREQIFPH